MGNRTRAPPFTEATRPEAVETTALYASSYKPTTEAQQPKRTTRPLRHPTRKRWSEQYHSIHLRNTRITRPTGHRYHPPQWNNQYPNETKAIEKPKENTIMFLCGSGMGNINGNDRHADDHRLAMIVRG